MYNYEIIKSQCSAWQGSYADLLGHWVTGCPFVLQKAHMCILMQLSPYGQLPLFLLNRMQCSGFCRLGGGGLVSVKRCGAELGAWNCIVGRKVWRSSGAGQGSAKCEDGENLGQS